MLNQFLDILIERLEKSIDKKKVGNSKTANGMLIRSFRKAMFYSGNNMPKASVSFLAYGRMPDMGVGKGTSINDRVYVRQSGRQTGERNTRRRKAWYSKTKAGQIMRFRELMVKQFGDAMVQEVELQLTQTMTLNNII
jgi:hypothetical protein